jgi:hypothetical protein
MQKKTIAYAQAHGFERCPGCATKLTWHVVTPMELQGREFFNGSPTSLIVVPVICDECGYVMFLRGLP